MGGARGTATLLGAPVWRRPLPERPVGLDADPMGGATPRRARPTRTRSRPHREPAGAASAPQASPRRIVAPGSGAWLLANGPEWRWLAALREGRRPHLPSFRRCGNA